MSKKLTVKKGKKPLKAAEPKGNTRMDLELVKEFTHFMKANDLAELEVRSGTVEIRLKRMHTGPMPSSGMTFAAPQVAPPNPTEVEALKTLAPAPSSRKFHLVSSPFVGTFYRSAGPNQESFVEPGKKVALGDTLCIIEAMKLMNEIESDIKGRIVKVLVENGTPVEFGEPLFEVEPL